MFAHRQRLMPLVVPLVLGALAAGPAIGVVTEVGSVRVLSATTNAVGNRVFRFDVNPTGTVEVTAFAPDVVRVRFHFVHGLYDREEVAITKPFSNWPAFAATVTQSSTNWVLDTSNLRVEVALSNRFLVNFRDEAGRDLLLGRGLAYDVDYQMLSDTSAYTQIYWPNGVTSISNRPTGFKLRATMDMPDDKAFFGLGDFGGPLNRRGQVLQFWGQDTYQFTESHKPKYTALPFWYGVRPASTAQPARAYGIFFNNPARPVVDLALTNGTYTFDAGDDQLDYFFFGGGASQTMHAVIDRFSELTGRPAFLPKWAYGYHQSRHSYFSQQSVLDLIQTFRGSNIPCDAVYLDIGVQQDAGQPHQLTFNTNNYTNVSALVATATNAGIRLVPIVEPLLTTNDPMYNEAAAGLYFIKDNGLANYVGTNFLGRVSWLDFSIQATRDWWHGKLTNYLAKFGFESIWNDLTEPNENAMPVNTIWYLGGRYGDLTTNDTRKWHSNNKNTYSLLSSQVSFDALRARRPTNRPFVLTRSAWPGVQQYAAGWSGDNVSSYDHLRFNTRLALSVMISGQANFGNDIGGFVDDTRPELLSRWLQAGVFSPLYRNHTTLFTANQEPWAFGEPWTTLNRRTIRLRYEWLPHLYSLAHQAATNGTPMNTPVAFEFMADTNTWAANELDLMVGRDVLVAPVVVSGAVTRAVYLPSGANWYYEPDDAYYAGGQTVTVRAALSTIPVFVRAGAVIVRGPAMAFADASPATNLAFEAWPGGSGSFALFEDDGLTTNWSAGAGAWTPVSAVGSGTQLTVTVAARTGSYVPPSRSLRVVARAMSNTTAVLKNGAPLDRFGSEADLVAAAGEGWAYDTVARRAVAKIADTGAAASLVFSGDTQTVAAVAFASAYTTMAVSATFNGWNDAARNMKRVADRTWAAVLTVNEGGLHGFRFVANDDPSAGLWGHSGQSDFTVPMTATGTASGADIVLSNLAAGVYSFRFHETSFAYSVTGASGTDSDGDGMDDAWEAAAGLDPALAGDAGTDLEGDGLVNSNEYLAGGNAVRADTDGDGSGDLDEFIAGTSLTNAIDFFRVSAHERSGSGADIVWAGVTGRAYGVFVSTNLIAPGWSVLAPFSNVVGSPTITVTDTNDAAFRAYHIRVRRAP